MGVGGVLRFIYAIPLISSYFVPLHIYYKYIHIYMRIELHRCRV